MPLREPSTDSSIRTDAARDLPVDVDVVIPAHNAAATIATTIEAVLVQQPVSISVTVVDDGSTDDTGRIVRAFADRGVRLIEQDNSGPSAARNAGARGGRGTWVALLDADMTPCRYWLADLLEQAHSEIDVIGCGGVFQLDGAETRRTLPKPRNGNNGLDPVFTPGLFIVRRQTFEDVDGYDEALRYSENSDLGFRVLTRIGDLDRRVTAVTATLVVITDTVDGRSAQFDLERRLDSAERVLQNNQRFFRVRPALAANYHAVAGVAALKLGRHDVARPHLRSAVRLNPLRPKWWVNTAIAHLGLRRRPDSAE